MGLASLKRKETVEYKPAICSVDAFIDDAEAYAAGFPNIVIGIGKKPLLDRRKKNRDKEMKSKDPVGPEFKHATFTLTTQSIEILSILAKRDQFNKSKLIRILLENHINKSRSERVLVYQKAKTV